MAGGAIACGLRDGPARLTPGPHLTVAAGERTAAADRGRRSAAGERPIRIGPFDKLAVNVFGVPELSRHVQVDASGRMSLAAGRRDRSGRQDARRSLPGRSRAALRGRYVRDPQVTVNLEETVSQVVTVDGEVREPGLYPVVGRMTLMRAIATAKGTTEFARLAGCRRLPHGRRPARWRRSTICGRSGAALYADPEIFANDVVVVGDSPARRLFRDILQASPLLATPIIALLQQQSVGQRNS